MKRQIKEFPVSLLLSDTSFKKIQEKKSFDMINFRYLSALSNTILYIKGVFKSYLRWKIFFGLQMQSINTNDSYIEENNLWLLFFSKCFYIARIYVSTSHLGMVYIGSGTPESVLIDFRLKTKIHTKSIHTLPKAVGVPALGSFRNIFV